MMKNALIVLLFLLAGCTQYSIRNIDKPPPERYEIWKKSGVNILGVRKVLLECGAVMPSWTADGAYEKNNIIKQSDQTNHSFLVDRCMLKAGFIQQNTSWSLKEACADARYRNYPACQPDAIIPTPSVERRLNSWYCKVKSDYNYCLEHALAPQLCTPEKAKNPPPECLADGHSSLNTVSDKGKILAPESPENQEYNRRKFEQQQLQHNIQNQNNRRMNEMLNSTAPKTKR